MKLLTWRMKGYLLLIIIPVLWLSGCAATGTSTAGEVRAWYAKYGVENPFAGPIYYRGSDEGHHYFICRSMDTWVFFKVRKEEVSLPEEHPVRNASDAPVPGYYAVDPLDGFRRTRAE